MFSVCLPLSSVRASHICSSQAGPNPPVPSTPSNFRQTGVRLRRTFPSSVTPCVLDKRNSSATTNELSSNEGRYGGTSAASSVRVGQTLVYPPLQPWRSQPKGLIQFLGGAYIGRSPELTYRLFIELLAKEGYLIVATPYEITFDHSACAVEIHRKFNDALNILLDSGFARAGLSAEDVAKLPIYSVGHSNGALMQVLIGCICKEGKLPKANAIISFNNKSASEAVPYFDQVGPRMVQIAPLLAPSPVTSFVRFVAEDIVPAVGNFLGPRLAAEADLTSLSNFFGQIPGVLNQVIEGVSEFTPSPAENRETVACSYTIANTLLVKYTVDSIDETDILEELLQPRIQSLGGKLDKIVLTGTHATPLAPDIKWQVGSVYTPFDAVGQVLRSAALADLRGTARYVVDWFDLL